MHEYTVKEIDGIKYGHYECEGGTFEFKFINDADAQTQIDNFLTELYICLLYTSDAADEQMV